jgi:hypothetical protein
MIRQWQQEMIREMIALIVDAYAEIEKQLDRRRCEHRARMTQ